ncbi:cellulose synthase-like protein e1 [Fagus crenata]
MGKKGGREEAIPLFETKEARFRGAYKVFASTVSVGICLIWVYRLTHIPRAGEQGRWAWIDPKMEPPTLVINTVLSCMSYNYPPDRLSIYLSDDGGSELTYYALLEASNFSKHWIPFCKKFNVEQRSPSAYCAQRIEVQDITYAQEWLAIKVVSS